MITYDDSRLCCVRTHAYYARVQHDKAMEESSLTRVHACIMHVTHRLAACQRSNHVYKSSDAGMFIWVTCQPFISFSALPKQEKRPKLSYREGGTYKTFHLISMPT
jgi:hypothetical protein